MCECVKLDLCEVVMIGSFHADEAWAGSRQQAIPGRKTRLRSGNANARFSRDYLWIILAVI